MIDCSLLSNSNVCSRCGSLHAARMFAWLMIWYRLGLSMDSGYSCLSRTWVIILGSDMINACKSHEDFQSPRKSPLSLGHGP